MTRTLLAILKTVDIAFLVILGLLLGVLLAVLFIPARYEAEGNYHGQLLPSVCATWFFHILVLGVVYKGEDMVRNLKVLNFQLWHNREKDPVRDSEDGLETILGDEEQLPHEEPRQDKERYRKAQEEHRRTDTDGRAGDNQSREKQSSDGQPGGKQTHDI